MSKNPSLPELEPPINIKDALAEQRSDFDCLPCRLMGSTAFAGLGIYSYASGMKQLREREYEILKSGSKFGMRSRRAGIYAISATLVGLGVYRLQN
ncbi:uncharacterized protein RCC_08257 [Ramularia collo-cygni]|uniref:Distal membrane-arm assembly complex protein 1-like domain-containing protein n=1 Tax=Ramularia collo-cygni TaxID=112498 RepID=A0A2D3VC47_9PEZI|nr:uncharacterized protein RCC_08257 [Ramularia collo-cygni]CZT22387.1 uncharacterized protein RCC_08257 [Ramularia collo-cygni]